LWLHSLKVAQLLRSAACLHTNQSRSYLNHLVHQVPCIESLKAVKPAKYDIVGNTSSVKNINALCPYAQYNQKDSNIG